VYQGVIEQLFHGNLLFDGRYWLTSWAICLFARPCMRGMYEIDVSIELRWRWIFVSVVSADQDCGQGSSIANRWPALSRQRLIQAVTLTTSKDFDFNPGQDPVRKIVGYGKRSLDEVAR
jgi:hypothetical protein